MNKTTGEAVALVGALKSAGETNSVEVLIAPPFTALGVVHDAISGTNIALGAQNMYWETSGAFTGEISPEMLKDIGCEYVIIAHSERRQFFGETNATANRKLKAAYAHGLKPIYCVGETLEQREAGQTQILIGAQIREGLEGVTAEQMGRTVLAYEPVWAIGTGKTATPKQAQEVHAFIRSILNNLFGDGVASGVRIQYGGSVKPDNVASLLSETDIDGALVGGASLQADAFGAMIQAVSGLEK